RPERARISGSNVGTEGDTWSTTKTDPGKSAGRPATSRWSAETPPAEAPTVTTSCASILDWMPHWADSAISRWRCLSYDQQQPRPLPVVRLDASDRDLQTTRRGHAERALDVEA